MSARHRLTALLVAIVVGALPAMATANDYSEVLRSYELHGTIPPCAFTGAQLSAALKEVDVYGQQYFADFTDAVQSALSQRASGACTASGGALGLPARGGGGPALHLPAVTAPTGADLPLPLWLLAGVGGLALLSATVTRLRRWAGLGPREGAWRHLWAEAGWRATGAVEDFRDWYRRPPGPAGISRRGPARRD